MDHLQIVTDITLNFLSQLGCGEEVGVSVEYDKNADIYQIFLQTQDPSLLIGYHGETLSSLQLILGQHVHKQVGAWLNLSLNVNDYKERRESAVFALADSAVERVLATNQPHSLPPMPSFERRLVHLRLADHPKVVTTSEGVGRTRSVIVSPKA